MDSSGWIILLAAALAVALWGWIASVRHLRGRLREAQSSKKSQSTRYGQISEQFAPFMEAWPWDPKSFRFLGSPVDGVQFNADGIVFVEIKTAGSQLSPLQRQVRDHIQQGRVTWHEVRLR